MKIFLILVALFFSLCVAVRLFDPTFTRRELIEMGVLIPYAVTSWMFVIYHH